MEENNEKADIQPNTEDSQKLAMVIECMKAYFPMLDVPYAKQVIKSLHEQSGRQDTLSILAPRYDHKRSELLHVQANALNHLVSFYEELVHCEMLKRDIQKNSEHNSEIEKMFL